MSVKLDVSLGEALDKLTILEIKKNKIHDHRQKDIMTEFNYLSQELHKYTQRHKYLYSILYKTNARIWDCMDIIRESNKPVSEVYEYVDETIVLNDSRYLVKKKINEVCNSFLKEQKGYNIRILNVILNCDMDTIIILNGAIRYYSFFYDEVILSSASENIQRLKRMFNDDRFIIVNDTGISDTDQPMNGDCVTVNQNDITVKVSQSFLIKNNNSENDTNNKYSNEIKNIYRKLGLNVNIFDEYNYDDSSHHE
jgi:hypothetical protein